MYPNIKHSQAPRRRDLDVDAPSGGCRNRNLRLMRGVRKVQPPGLSNRRFLIISGGGGPPAQLQNGCAVAGPGVVSST